METSLTCWRHRPVFLLQEGAFRWKASYYSGHECCRIAVAKRREKLRRKANEAWLERMYKPDGSRRY